MRPIHALKAPIEASKQFKAGFWVACGAIVAIALALLFYSAGKGDLNPTKVYYPLVSRIKSEEAKREVRAWSNIGFLHYHRNKHCTVFHKMESEFIGSGVAFGEPKRQSFDGYEMDPCPLCVKAK